MASSDNASGPIYLSHSAKRCVFRSGHLYIHAFANWPVYRSRLLLMERKTSATKRPWFPAPTPRFPSPCQYQSRPGFRPPPIPITPRFSTPANTNRAPVFSTPPLPIAPRFSTPPIPIVPWFPSPLLPPTPWSEGDAALWAGRWNHAEDVASPACHRETTLNVRDNDFPQRDEPDDTHARICGRQGAIPGATRPEPSATPHRPNSVAPTASLD